MILPGRPVRTLAGRLGPALLWAGLLASPAAAHNLILEAYVVGDAIEGEAFFSDGILVGDTEIDVLGPDGAALGAAMTDASGAFRFTPEAPVDHLFRLDAGSGHVAEALVAAADLPGALGSQAEGAALTSAGAPAGGEATAASAGPTDTPTLAALTREAIRAQTRPLRQDWALYTAKTPLPVALGGIGYILGLSGLCYYLMAWHRRRRIGASA
ncbi:cobalt ABC transporter permease [Pseudoroseicyclus sp. CXY001]|uniref:cobalt ABC transporter permease n=1 Tax=Pseudoroseicyclus sp. CXY001 TaxID=3242492 RepID=UPI00358DA6D7